ncbi:MAG TPA: Holliday junction branch migration protein RuvA [Blastocatellia bacterium]|nr:Holliday junction branch migration protein RuvA [Blastocatellia bacterium]
MIAQLTGKLTYKLPNSAIIDVGGVGYEVHIPVTTFYELGEPGSEVSLKIHTHVREDAIQLFGFRTYREKDLFLKLTSVSGIGPKLGITMLSGMPAGDLIRAIKAGDLAKLTAIPGVGRKTAERVVVELRDKVSSDATDLQEAEPLPAHEGQLESVRGDTVAALIALGYPKPMAERAVAAALAEQGEVTIEAVLKRSLKRLFKP